MITGASYGTSLGVTGFCIIYLLGYSIAIGLEIITGSSF
jgi:hypothetical protein